VKFLRLDYFSSFCFIHKKDEKKKYKMSSNSTRSSKARDKAVLRHGSVASLSDPGSPSPPKDDDVSPAVIVAIERAVESFLGTDKLSEKISSALVDRISQKVISGLAASLEAANQQIEQLRAEVVALKDQLRDKDEMLADRLDGIEQYQRRNCLRIFGVPENDGEDTDDVVVGLCREKLKVDMDVTNIDRSHRVGRRATSGDGPHARPRGILVKFTSYRYRRLVFLNKRNLKGSGIVVKEDLTRRRMDLYNQAAQKHGHNSVWTVDGRIYWVDKEGKKDSYNN
jgi:hypothetical protein